MIFFFFLITVITIATVGILKAECSNRNGKLASCTQEKVLVEVWRSEVRMGGLVADCRKATGMYVTASYKVFKTASSSMAYLRL